MRSFIRTSTLAVLYTILAVPAAALAEDSPSPVIAHRLRRIPCVRVVDRVLVDALADGEARSPTFRRLMERLGRSDLIVHVERVVAPMPVAGRTQFVSTAGGYRYARVTLTFGGPTDPAIALLGHELQHLVELADAPSVVDGSTHAALYRDIGYASGLASCLAGECYDTRAAVDAGYRVLAELRESRMRHGRTVETRLARLAD